MRKYFDNVVIVPNNTTHVEHRSECCPYYNGQFNSETKEWDLTNAQLPIFASPMSCVVDDKNYIEFLNNKIIPIIPRTISLQRRMELMKDGIWIALGLDEFENLIEKTESFQNDTYICVDLANGHMIKLLKLCKKAKKKFNNLKLMTGNIANVTTYDDYAKAGIDLVRVGIGTGGACATNDFTGIGVGEIYDFLKDLCWRKEHVENEFRSNFNKYLSIPGIVYDGGCGSIRDIIIALGLGADYVMCGKLFAQSEEACGEIVSKLMPVTKKDVKVTEFGEDGAQFYYYQDITEKKFVRGRIYYGMSTERAQAEMGKSQIKHSEGKEYWVEILYTLSQFVKDFVDCIKSTMSYCDALTLDQFIGKTNYRWINQR